MVACGMTCELVTIPISHYCEKARWALERAGVPYVERAHIQALHRIYARRAGGGLTVPVLRCPAGVLVDSTEILAWTDTQAPAEQALYPQDPAVADEVRALAADFDLRLGVHSRRWLYQELRQRRDLALAYGCRGVPRWERAFLRWGYPLLIRIVAGVLDVSPATSEHSELEVRAIFDEVGERLSDGRRYLGGERFSAADLTFAALASPLLLPVGYGVPLPGLDELPAHTRKVAQELRAHPAGVYGLRMYETERHGHPSLSSADA